MISDVLCEAVSSIDGYLENPLYDTTYGGELRERIIKLRNDMAQMQGELDTPPDKPVLPIVPFEAKQSMKDEVAPENQQQRKIGISITVLDESPEKIIFGLMDGWEQPFNLDETDKALLAEVSEKYFSLYEGEMMTNVTLNDMASAINKFMLEHHYQRYSGLVRVRRGRKVGDEYRYRYF